MLASEREADLGQLDCSVARKRQRHDSTEGGGQFTYPEPLMQFLAHYKRVSQDYPHHRLGSDVAFIWAFIDGIEDATLKSFTQKRLLRKYPTMVTEYRQAAKQRNGRRVHIKGLTWQQVKESVNAMPYPAGYLDRSELQRTP
jgi:hypothetical protein